MCKHTTVNFKPHSDVIWLCLNDNGNNNGNDSITITITITINEQQ